MDFEIFYKYITIQVGWSVVATKTAENVGEVGLSVVVGRLAPPWK